MKGTNAYNCIRVTIILQNPLTLVCFGPYWPIIMEYNNCMKRVFDILDFKLSPCFDCSFFSFGYVPGVSVLLYADVSELSIGSIF